MSKTYKEIVAAIKAELKAEVALLRAHEAAWRKKTLDPTFQVPQDLIFCKFQPMRWRAKHLAYCLFRGKTLEQIEPRRREDRVTGHKQADYWAKLHLVNWNEEAAEDIAAYQARKALAVPHE